MTPNAPGALAGCRVLDLSHAAYAYAGKLLADLAVREPTAFAAVAAQAKAALAAN